MKWLKREVGAQRSTGKAMPFWFVESSEFQRSTETRAEWEDISVCCGSIVWECENGGIRGESPQKNGGEQEEDGSPQSSPALSSPQQLLFSQIQTLSGKLNNHSLTSFPIFLFHSPSSTLFWSLQLKHVKSRTIEKELVVVRRSSRVANLPTPVYKEVTFVSSLPSPHSHSLRYQSIIIYILTLAIFLV